MIQFKLSTPQEFGAMLQWVRDNVLRAIGHRKWIIVTLESDADRSTDQNSKFHAMINDINIGAIGVIGMTNIDMRNYDFDDCKALLVRWFITEKELNGDKIPDRVKLRKVYDPMYGDWVYSRPSTTQFGKKLTAEFIEFIYATGSQLGVVWSEPAMREYQGYKEFQNG